MQWNRTLGVVGAASLGLAALGCSNSTGPSPSQTIAAVTISSGNNQNAVVSTQAAAPLVVLVTDASNRAISGATVHWTAVHGGTVSAATSVTDASGKAAVTRTVGDTLGGYVTKVTAGSASASFVTLGTAVASTYSVQVVFLSEMSPADSAAFLKAAARWSSIVVAGFPGNRVQSAAGNCGDNSPAFDKTITSVMIFATVDSIDGPGSILGGAAPCYVRTPAPSTTLVGFMEFDSFDLPTLQANGLLNTVILHEMGHVLGIGTLWTYPWQNPTLLMDAVADSGASALPYFVGTTAIAQFNADGGSLFPGNKVPVENTGGSGTADGHWRETVMGNELMTGFVALGANPLSTITIGSMADIGYTVNYTTADPYTVTNPALRAAGSSTVVTQLRELRPSGPIQGVDRSGQVIRLR